MREQTIKTEPFELLDVLQCSGMAGADCHGYMTVKGHINADKEDDYLGILQQPEVWASIKVRDESGVEIILFSGIVTEGAVEVQNGLKTLMFTVRTGSFLMDVEEHIRTFQDKGITYEDVMGTLVKPYPSGGCIMCEGKGKAIGRFLCQYQETDWQFAVRLGSCCGAAIFPNYNGYGPKVYFGLPDGTNQGELILTEYVLNQSAEGVSYSVKLREIFNVGDKVSFLGKPCRVISRRTELEAGELCHTYILAEREMPKRSCVYNDKLAGVSLSASVVDVQTTEVCVSILQDENKSSCGSRRFSYATVYSSIDGTGWYCMPEIGDRVRVYFPSNKEDDSYVLHSEHLESANKEERVNPDYKSFMNKQGKEILFKPDSILVTNNTGMSLELSDEEGVSIVSDKKITIKSDEAIEITSVNGNVDMVASNKIVMDQGGTKMVLSDKMTMRGAKVRLD